MTETFYDLLGVSDDASTGDIEDAYRAAIKRVHPDVSDDVDASERTKRLNKAKQVLTDDAERERYDRLGHRAYVSKSFRGGTATAPTNAGVDEDDAGVDEDETGADGDDATANTGGRGWQQHGSRWSDARGAGSADGSGSDDPGQKRTGRDQDDTGTRGTGSKSGSAPGTASDAGNWSSTTTGSDDGSGTWAGRGPWPSGGETRDGRRSASSTDSGGGGEDGAAGVGTSTGSGPGTSSGRGAQSRDRTGPSRASQGPSWHSSRPGGPASSTGGGPGGSTSTRPGSPTRDTDGSTVDWSWNAWNRTGSWAVRQGTQGQGGFDPRLLVPDEQSVLLLTTTFFLYPFFVASVLFPAFPLVARVTIGVCTLLMFAYLLSVPEVAVVVFGLWSVLLPAAMLVIPGIGLVSLAGVVGLSVTWVPLGLSILTLSVLGG